MEKKQLKIFLVSLFVIICQSLTTGCQSSPSSGEENGNIRMSGSVWASSIPGASSVYTFHEKTYEVKYFGAMEECNILPATMAKVGGIEGYGTGTYSVSGREVTLRPKGEMYLMIDSDGKISLQHEEAFTLTIEDPYFELGIVTYIRLPPNKL